uniref:Uncharacterized protein n=1 Tax=Tanacetum cinerariifolium TaxID=118510 RepID=A0A699J1S4_TANCI|nr:hypothetical protein [Tanacetum cinerariifolium]
MDVEDSDTKDSDDLASGTGKKEALQPYDKKRKNMYIHYPCYGSGREGAKGTDATHSPMEKKKRFVKARETHHRQPEIIKLGAAAASQHMVYVDFQ